MEATTIMEDRKIDLTERISRILPLLQSGQHRSILEWLLGNFQKMKKANSTKLQLALDYADTWMLVAECLRNIFPPQTRNYYSDGSIFYELHESLLPYIAQSQQDTTLLLLEYISLEDFPLERIKASLDKVIQLPMNHLSLLLLKRFIETSKYGKGSDSESIVAHLIPHIPQFAYSNDLRDVLVKACSMNSLDWTTPKDLLVVRSITPETAIYLVNLIIDFVPLSHRYSMPFSLVSDLIEKWPHLGSELLYLLHTRKCYSPKIDELYKRQSAYLYEYALKNPAFWTLFIEIDIYAAWEHFKTLPMAIDIVLIKSLIKHSTVARIVDQVIEWLLLNTNVQISYEKRDVEELAMSLSNNISESLAAKIVTFLTLSNTQLAHILLLALIVSYKSIPTKFVSQIESYIDSTSYLQTDLKMALASKQDRSLVQFSPFGDGSECVFDPNEALMHLEWLPALKKAPHIEELFSFLLSNHLQELIPYLREFKFYCLKFIRKPFLMALSKSKDCVRFEVAKVVQCDFLSKTVRLDLLRVLLEDCADEAHILRLLKKNDCKELVELYIKRKEHSSVALFSKFLSACPEKVQMVANGNESFLKVLYQHALKHRFANVLEYNGSDVLIWHLYVQASDGTAREEYITAASQEVTGKETEEALMVKLALHPNVIHKVDPKHITSRVLLDLLSRKKIPQCVFDYLSSNFFALPFNTDDSCSWNCIKILIQKRKNLQLPNGFAQFLCNQLLDCEDAMLCVRGLIVLRFNEIYRNIPMLLGALPFDTQNLRVAHLVHRVLAEDMVHRKRRKAAKYLVAPALLLLRSYLKSNAVIQVSAMHLRTLISLIEVFSTLQTKRKRSSGVLLKVLSKWAFHEPNLQVQLRILREKMENARKKRRLEQNY